MFFPSIGCIKLAISLQKDVLSRTLLKINKSEGRDIKFTGVISSFSKLADALLSFAGMRTG